MGHQYKTTNNNHGGDSPIKGFYLSPFTRTISIGIIIFSVAFLVSCLTASIMTPVQNSDATTGIDLNDNSVAYFVNIASATNGTAGVISKEVHATAAGTLGVIEDRLNITSNTPNGYKVYVSMANDTNQQKLVNIDDSSYFFNPISGSGISLSNPGNLSQANTWGVAVASTWNSHFDNVSAYTVNPIAQTTKFAPVPAYGEEELLITQDDTTTASTQTDNISVYYGYHATSALPSGTYRNTVLYTAYSEATDHAGGIATYTGSGLNYKTGGTLTITTSLYTDRTIKADEVSVSVVDGAENKPCTIANDAAITKVDAGSNDSVRIVCSAPSVTKPGYYTLKVDIDGYAHHSTNTVFYDTPGLTATVAGNPVTITEMQDMTGDICMAWNDVKSASSYNSTKNKPYAFTSGTGPIYTYGSDLSVSEGTIVADPVTNWDSVTAVANVTSGPAISNINTDVPETYLKDNRDGNYYRVRKLADGNCWMTENLRLVFYSDDDLNGYAQVGVVNSDGTIGQSLDSNNNPIVITTANTNISSDSVARDFGESVAYTETDIAGSVTHWYGTTNGVAVKHAEDNTCTTDDATCSANSMAYSKSLYDDTTDGLALLDDDTQIVGTYYNWKAATAGTGDTTNTNRPDDSICPKGWQLPLGSTNAGTKSLANLIIHVYGGGGYDASINPDGITTGNASSGQSYYHTVNGAHIYAMAQTMRRAPISIPFSGILIVSASATHVGNQGALWSSWSESDAYAWVLHFYNNYLNTRTSRFKGRGYSIRCIAPSTYDMQDVANWEDSVDAGETVTAVDTRDGNKYNVSRLPDGNLWMTENLRITGTIPASGSNFTGSDFNVSQYDLETDGSTYCAMDGASTSDPKGYSNVCSHTGVDLNGDPTVWYNDAAATAGTITGYANSSDATMDICPAGWRMPTLAEASNIIPYKTEFNPTKGGFYVGGVLTSNNTNGYWRTSNVGRDAQTTYYLSYSNSQNLYTNSGSHRAHGIYIRCIRNS